jgi:hypothetical protein
MRSPRRASDEAQMLQDLTWFLRSLHERVEALEARWPTWASGYLPHADIAASLGRLDRAVAAIKGKARAIATDPGSDLRERQRRQVWVPRLHAARLRQRGRGCDRAHMAQAVQAYGATRG